MQNQKSKFKISNFTPRLCALNFSLFAILVAVTIFGSTGCRTAGQPPKQKLVEIPKAELESTESNIAKTVCELIYQGKFEAANELIEQSTQHPQLGQLAQIVQEYRGINQRRHLAREAAYQEQLAELESLRATPDTNDANDANGITKLLSVINKTREFANEQQRNELLSEPFVKQTIQRAQSKAAELESKGKWLDAYITCYSWLQAIDKDNKAYSDHAERLLKKANIVASFQDSPCESRQERYKKVKKEMFTRAVNALNFNYVNIIDYHQMTTEAIKRCELLAEVIKSSRAVRDALSDGQYDVNDMQYDNKLAAWSVGLATILEEIHLSAMGISKDKFIDIFEKVLELNETTVELPRSILIAHFSEAALSALDPYTVMVWPKQVQDFEKTMTNEFTGIGIEISKQKGLLTVMSLLPDTPAYNSGLDAADVIEAVDGVLTKDMTLTCAVHSITGPRGTNVTLTIKRPGEDKTFDITITRDRITVPTIRGWQRTDTGKWLYMIDDENKIGYVRITSFSERTASNLEKALRQLEQEGLRGLILDLRSNSGGLLDSATEVVDKFIKEGLIVSTRPRFGVWTYAPAHRKGTHPNYPLVILTNSTSASASEIVAGALQDPKHKRAILVGSRTHGKGSVQGITHHPGGGAQLKYTMAYYHLPSGQRVESQEVIKKQGRQDWGVGPDIEIKLRSDEFKEMLDVQRDNNVLVKADHDNSNTPLKKHTVEETLAVDPQLAVGILIVKTKLIENNSPCTRHLLTTINQESQI